jgi:hypothetical protein
MHAGNIARTGDPQSNVVVYGPASGNALVRSEQPDADTAQLESNCDGYMIMYNRNQQLCKKGTFRKCVLVDGEEYVYDNAGALVQIKVYQHGKYVGDSPLPYRK